MGKAFRDLTGLDGNPTTTPEMRKLCQRPGKKDKDGNNIYTTQQHHNLTKGELHRKYLYQNKKYTKWPPK